MKIFVVFYILFSIVDSQKVEPCEDRYQQCKVWKSQNLCLQYAYKEYMMRTCPQSCNICKDNSATNSQDFKQNAISLPIVKIETTTKVPEMYIGKSNTTSLFANNSNNEIPQIPQAMRLIQSISQMISQKPFMKKITNENNSDRNKIRLTEKPRKKSSLKSEKIAEIVVLPKSKLETADDESIESNENTLRMLIKNKKRSHVNKKPLKSQQKFKNIKKLKGSNKQMINVSPNAYLKPQTLIPYNISDIASLKKDTTTTTQIYIPTETTTTEIITTTEDDEENTPALVQPQILDEERSDEATDSPVTVDTVTVPQSQTTAVHSQPIIQNQEQENDDQLIMYSMVLKQNWDPDFDDTTSSKFSILKGNIIQDVGYTLGSDAVVGHVQFDEISGKNDNALTKATFSISGDTSKISDLQDEVNNGDVNGLLVQPFSFHRE